MEILLGWVIFSILAGWFWSSKGRSGIGGFVLSLLLSPLVGFIVGVILAPNMRGKEQAAIQSGEMRKCPHCAETIRREARVCRYCGREVLYGGSPDDPRETVRRQYEMINARHYDDVSAMSTDALRPQRTPAALQGWFGDVAFSVVGLELTSREGPKAVIDATVDVSNTSRPAGPPRRMQDRFTLVLEQDKWRIEKIDDVPPTEPVPMSIQQSVG